MKVLVAACGRSGTAYTAMGLQQMGFNAMHENWDENTDICVSSCHLFDGPYPLFVTNKKSFPYDILVHQVRHPLSVIGSAETLRDDSWEWIWETINIGIDMPHNKVIRAAHYWIHWNSLISKASPIARIRVEDLEFPKLRKNVNKRDHSIVNWTDIPMPLRNQVQLLCRDYGYRY